MFNIDDVKQIKSLREFDINTHISLKNDYIFFQVSKAASSTVKYYLQKCEVMDTQRDIIDVNNRNLSPHIWPSQLKEDSFFELLSSPIIHKIAFVRDPFSRLLSCYLHRIKASPNSPSVKNIKRFTHDKFDDSLSFSDFIHIVCDQNCLEQDSHWRVQSDEIFYDFIPKWSFIGKIERLEEDLKELMLKLVPSYSVFNGELKDLSPSITKAHTKLGFYYTSKLESKVVDRFQADFENFDYKPYIEQVF